MTQTASPPTPHADTLVEAALQVLNTADPYQKSQLTHQFATPWLQGLIPHPYHPSLDFPIPDRPARLDNVWEWDKFSVVFCGVGKVYDETSEQNECNSFDIQRGMNDCCVKLVAPGMMPKLGKGGSLQSRQAIVHSLVHTESWAIDLSWSLVVELHINAKAVRRDIGADVEMVVKMNVWLSLCLQDIIARFGFVKVAQDEGRHFMLLAARLKELGSSYGSLPAHDGLWDSAMATSNNLLARLAIEHCVHEARGLDVLPTTIACFRSGKDDETADLLEKVVYLEEITHCAAGVKWFKYLCLRRKSLDKGNITSSETVSEGENSIQEEDETMK